MNQGAGGWVLQLRCVTCDAEDSFRGVLLTLAGDRAIETGWQVSRDLRTLNLPPGSRDGVCPKCSAVLGKAVGE